MWTKRHLATIHRCRDQPQTGGGILQLSFPVLLQASSLPGVHVSSHFLSLSDASSRASRIASIFCDRCFSISVEVITG